MLLPKQHLASQSDVVFIKRAYGALYAYGKGHRSFPGRGRSPAPDRLDASLVERAGRGMGPMNRVGRNLIFNRGYAAPKNESIHCPRKEAPGQTSYPCRLDAPAI